ncbi:hypothetical protein RUM44_009380 [Polyplax serrata]|uniref:Uncharacterized protein n=1 Tax=Polyplax serrata TaxID=468196 RepID=A0ABR1AU10_POLSC
MSLERMSPLCLGGDVCTASRWRKYLTESVCVWGGGMVPDIRVPNANAVCVAPQAKATNSLSKKRVMDSNRWDAGLCQLCPDCNGPSVPYTGQVHFRSKTKC